MALRTHVGLAAIQEKYALRPDERDCHLRGDAAKNGKEQKWAVVHDGGGQERSSQLAMGRPVTFIIIIAALHGDSARRALLVASYTLRSDQSPVR
jgi:hypothetical protein